jgi:hypothetical protein
MAIQVAPNHKQSTGMIVWSPWATGDPASVCAPLPHSDPVLFPQNPSQETLPELAAGPAGQTTWLGWCSRIRTCYVRFLPTVAIRRRSGSFETLLLCRVRVLFTAQDAMGDLFEWEHGIFGADGPVSQLEGIMRRHRLALLKHLQHKPRQFCSPRHSS